MSEDKPKDKESPGGLGGQVEQLVMPMQPIKNRRFVPNRIVEAVLAKSELDMNDIASMEFTRQEREQFAQLIGYSLSGFSELSYVSDETYESVEKMAIDGCSELEGRNAVLREQADSIRPHLRELASLLFRIHPDDLAV